MLIRSSSSTAGSWRSREPTRNYSSWVAFTRNCIESSMKVRTVPLPCNNTSLVLKATMSHSLIVLPEDTAQPILDALAAAKRSIQIRMFLFTDRGLTNAVIAANRRGVKVRVMLNPARRGGESENDETNDKLAHAGIEVSDSNPALQLTHQKSMVIDEEAGF